MNPSTIQPKSIRIVPPGSRELLFNGMIAVLIGLLYFLFRNYGVSDVGYFVNNSTTSLFKWLRDRWTVDYHYNHFSFSHWVPLISLGLVWLKRRDLRRLPRRINWIGLLVVLFGFSLHWAGLKSEQTRLSILSVIVLSWGFPFFVCGWPTARRLIFPCGFLLFSIPLNFFDALAQPVRIISASIAGGLLTGLGVETVRAGPYLSSARIEGLQVNLGDAAGSVFAIVAIVAYALLCSYLMRANTRKRIAVVVSAIPFLMCANIFRAMLVMMTGVVLSVQAGDYVQNNLSGWIALLVGFGGITVLAIALHRRKAGLLPSTGYDSANPGYSPAPALMVSIGITAFATWWIPAHSTVHHREEAGVNLELPEQIGSWHGGVILFCHNPEKPEEFFTHNQQPGDPCPTCGQPLQEMAPYERKLLPQDTLVRKNWYELGRQRRVYLSIVLSGKYRSSIHRPEVCLVGDGSQISSSFIHQVPLEDGRVLKVKILEMVHQYRDSQGHLREGTSYYAYWFAGIGRETPDHIQRMMWMASDRLFKSQSYRWAYLSLSGARVSGQMDYLEEVDSFLKLAYPHLIRK